MSKVKDEDYLFLSAMLRAKEAGMLESGDFAAMAGALTAADALKTAQEHGYPQLRLDTPAHLEEDLNAYRTEIYEELEALLAEPEILDLFRIKYDYHNAKAIVKAKALEENPDGLLSRAGRTDPDLLKTFLEDENAQGSMADAMREAEDVLARTGNPQLSDFVLDREYFKDLAICGKGLSSELASEYVRLLADAANLKAFVRSARMQKSADFLSLALNDEGSVPAKEFLESSADGLADLFMFSPLGDVASTAAEAIAGASLAAFELSCDNAISSYFEKTVFVPFGVEVVIAYLAALEVEIGNIRMLLSGKISGVDSERVKERLRDGHV